jgi:hypothetical protein
MTSHDAPTPDSEKSLGSPDPSLGGPTVDAAVENAEEGSQAEGDHVPSGQAASGESRVEQMPDVVDTVEDVGERD